MAVSGRTAPPTLPTLGSGEQLDGESPPPRVLGAAAGSWLSTTGLTGVYVRAPPCQTLSGQEPKSKPCITCNWRNKGLEKQISHCASWSSSVWYITHREIKNNFFYYENFQKKFQIPFVLGQSSESPKRASLILLDFSELPDSSHSLPSGDNSSQKQLN